MPLFGDVWPCAYIDLAPRPAIYVRSYVCENLRSNSQLCKFSQVPRWHLLLSVSTNCCWQLWDAGLSVPSAPLSCPAMQVDRWIAVTCTSYVKPVKFKFISVFRNFQPVVVCYSLLVVICVYSAVSLLYSALGDILVWTLSLVSVRRNWLCDVGRYLKETSRETFGCTGCTDGASNRVVLEAGYFRLCTLTDCMNYYLRLSNEFTDQSS